MTPDEAFLSVRQALTDHQLPGGVGLRDADRTFLIVLGREDRWAVPAITALLEQMGCETTASVNGHGIVYGKVQGRLLPAPAPAVRICSADCCPAGEAAAVTAVKRCTGPCGQVKDVEEFPWWRKARGYRGGRCYDCDRARQRAMYWARKARQQQAAG